MASKEARLKAVHKYDAKAYKKVAVRIPRSIEDEFTKKAGDSINAYILGLIKKDLGIEDEKNK